MRRLLMVACIILTPWLANARIVEHLVTPENVARFGWHVEAKLVGEGTQSFCVDPFGKDATPENYAVHVILSDFEGQLIASVEPAYKQAGQRHCFQFSVGGKHLQKAELRVTFIDRPHPSGDLFKLRLADFAKAK